MSKESKHCLICGAPLTGRKRKYCSKKCYNKSRTKKREREFCIVCGAKLPEGRSKYCSDKCRVKWYQLSRRYQEYKRAYGKRYYQENKEKINEFNRAYRESHKEKRRAQNRAYYHRKKYGIKREVFEEPLWLEPTCEDCLYYDECGGTKKECEYRV